MNRERRAPAEPVPLRAAQARTSTVPAERRSPNNMMRAQDTPLLVQEVVSSPGQPLDSAARTFMEPRFGHDFSGVRVHTDANAARSARLVNAAAYTVGHRVAFATGQYAPQSEAGRRLLAHELAHVVQQSRHGAHTASEPALEQDANNAAAAIGVSARTTVRASSSVRLSRQDTGEPRFNLRLVYPPNRVESHQGLSHAEALAALRTFANHLDAHIEGGLAGHRHHIRNHDEHPIVGPIADFFGGVSLPSITIWNPMITRLRLARSLIDAGQVMWAARELQQTAQETRNTERRMYEYLEGTVSGGERAVLGLEVVQFASATFITVATGGTAGVFVGAAYTGAQRFAGEASAVYYGLQDSIDWGGVAFDTLFSLAAGRFGGQLGRSIAARFGGKITAQMASALVVGRASGIAHGVARELYDGLRGRTNLTVQGFIDRLAEQLTLRAAFLDLVGATAGTATARGTATTPSPKPGSSPPTSTPTGGGEQSNDISAARARRNAATQGTVGAPRKSGAPGSTAVSPPTRPTAVAQRTGAFDGSAARQLQPAHAPQPQVAPVPEVVPAPGEGGKVIPFPVRPAAPQATQPGSGGASAPSAVPSAVAITAVQTPTTSSPPMQVRLELPPGKAVHANLYRALIRERRLEHIPGKPRQTAQADIWDRNLRPQGPMGMYEEIWQRFEQMGVPEARRLRPNWSSRRRAVDMEVDHRVEMQLLGASNNAWADSMPNYELLDQASNGSAGSTLRANIVRERQRLAGLYGPGMLTQRLVFTHLVVSPPAASAMRWLPEQIQDGEHYHALRRITRDR